MQLRPYQVPPVEKGITFFTQKKTPKPSVLVLPTGAGKSWIIAGIADGVQKLQNTKILVLQPKVELLLQNAEKYESFGFSAAVYCASAGRKEIGFVTYATLDSIIANIHLFVNAGFRNIIVDECDGGYPSAADSMFSKLLKALSVNGDIRLLGLTATPFRLVSTISGSRLIMLNKVRPAIFKDFLHICQIQEIAEKYWCPLEYICKQSDGSMLKINSSGNEYTDESIEHCEKNNFANIYNACMDMKYKHVLCFVRSVSQCHKLQRIVPNSAVVSANTPPKERAQIIKNFKSGKIRVLINVGVLAVGFDYPELDMVVPPPTNSLRLWYQIVGRLVRTHENKKIATVYDLWGMTEKFGRIETITIEKQDKNYEVFSNGRQVSSIDLKTANYVPPKSVGGVFVDLELDFGKFKGTKISECPEWYLQTLKEFQFKPKFAIQAQIYLQNKALEK